MLDLHSQQHEAQKAEEKKQHEAQKAEEKKQHDAKKAEEKKQHDAKEQAKHQSSPSTPPTGGDSSAPTPPESQSTSQESNDDDECYEVDDARKTLRLPMHLADAIRHNNALPVPEEHHFRPMSHYADHPYFAKRNRHATADNYLQ